MKLSIFVEAVLGFCGYDRFFFGLIRLQMKSLLLVFVSFCFLLVIFMSKPFFKIPAQLFSYDTMKPLLTDK